MKHFTGIRGTLAKVTALTFVAFCLILSGSVHGQGLPTATLSGHVSNEGQPLPGVSVTAKAPTLQGSRTAVTSLNGDYALINLPPGEYTISYQISGFQPLTKTARLGASQESRIDAVMSLTQIQAETVVVARGEQISETSTQSTTYTAELLSKLPVARTIVSAVNLTPGTNANGPNGAITISGAQSFENNMTVNGVNIQDNVRGTPNSLFIEDAVAETTTTTSGVSAEYGRFTGGVVNTITKSGGNSFSGSFRTTVNNDAWIANTPKDAGTTRVQSLLPVYEATLGGPLWKDRIWFFGALRIPKVTNLSTRTSAPGAAAIPYVSTDDEKRYEGKLTISPIQNHTLTGSYIRIDRTQGNYGFPPVPFYDLASLYDRELPQELITGNYNGVITDKFFVEAQYSKRKFTFVNSGGHLTDLVGGTTIFDLARGGVYNSPIFCAVCPGSAQERNNEDFLVKGTYFLSTPSIGSHNIVVGFDDFSGQILSNNWQSGTSFAANGTDAIFKNGDIFPVFDSSSYLGYYPIPVVAKPSDARTYSVFLNDSWKLNNNLSFNLGVRWDKNHAKDSRGAVTADDSDFSPRLAATFDPSGTGAIRFSASYARYVGAINDTQSGAASNAGQPSVYAYAYYGPEINTGDPNGPLMTRAQALSALFNWYGITAGNMFPTQNADSLFYASVPGVNTVIRDTLKSPSTDEFALSASSNLGNRGSVRVDGVYRKAGRFYSTRTDQSTGQVTDSLGNVFDLGIVQNLDDPLFRKYFGFNLQFAYRPLTGLSVGGNYTLSHTYGNFLGETAGSGPVSASVSQYPEFKQASWNNPSGDLLQDQRHKVRVYATYDLPVPKSVGNISFSALEQYDTGTPYGAAGTVRYCTTAGAACNWVANPGYATPPTSTSSPTYYYTARDAFRTDNISRTDVALNFSHGIGPVEIFVQPQVLNVFNNQAIIAVNTTVLSRTNGGANFTDFNPFTTSAPIECPQGATGATCKAMGANWQKGSQFGNSRTPLDYQLARTFRITAGIRF